MLTVCAPVPAQTPTADASKIFGYDTTTLLNLTIGKSETPAPGVTVSEISFDSPKGGRVPGNLVGPLSKRPFPAIVYMNWGQGNEGEFLSEAVEMARRGWTCPADKC